MPRITIDGREVDVAAGGTVLDGARLLGIAIPALCRDPGMEPFTSCMVCLVYDSARRCLTPSCAARAEDGMQVLSGTPDVLAARRQAVDLLLSEHVGDCEGPCRRACPAGMNAPLLTRQLRSGSMGEAAATVRSDIPLAAVIGRICPAPCEKACRRGRHDEPVAIRMLERFAADSAEGGQWAPFRKAATGRRVAVVGSGPAGLSAADYLVRMGHAVVLLDDCAEAGGGLRRAATEEVLPKAVLDSEIRAIVDRCAEFRPSTRLGRDVWTADLIAGFDAVIIAIGDSERDFLSAMGMRDLGPGPGPHRAAHGVVFAAGAVAGTGSRVAIRSIAEGRAAAWAADCFLAGTQTSDRKRRFNSTVARVSTEEMEALLRHSSRDGRTNPGGGSLSGFTGSEAATESSRCLHCDCRKLETCRLRETATAIEADARRFQGETRGAIRIERQHASVIYEPGKCIRCGLCVRITEQEMEPVGLAFIGRGFDLRIGAPFSSTLAQSLQSAGDRCVRACPTGALSFEDGDDRLVECGRRVPA